MENHENHHDENDSLNEAPAPAPPPPRELPPPPSPPPPSPHRLAPVTGDKNPALAGILSFLVPGLGQMYVGLTWRGAAFFLIEVAIFALTINHEDDLAILLPTLFFVWLFGILDAYRQATLANYGFGSQQEVPEPISGLLPGILLMVIGLYGALREYFDIDLSIVLDHWPILLMAFGAWLIFKTLRERGASLAEDVQV